MNDNLQDHIDKALSSFFEDQNNLDSILEAKNTYFSLTGIADDAQPDYEARMQNFNEWFLFDYIPGNRHVPYITEYFKTNNEIEEPIKSSLSNVTYSVYEYNKKAFSNNILLKDLVRNEKYVLRPENFQAGVLPNEVFAGRVLRFDGDTYLLNGIRYIPKEVKNLVIKEAKKIRKLGNPLEEKNFVFKLERSKTKCHQYSHMDPISIFKSELER